MIVNAKNKLIKNMNATLPDMSDVITGWFLNIEFNEVEKYLDGAYWKERAGRKIKTKGVVQPPSDEDLKILPEGQWSWEWLMVHCLPNLQLTVGEFIYYDNIKYKVMARKNFEKYGYVKYILLEAYRVE